MREDVGWVLVRTDEDLLFELGVAKVYETLPKGKKAFANYSRVGAEAFIALRKRLLDAICDSEKGKLRPWAKLVADGDARDIVVAVITIASAQLGVAAAVAVPFAGLIAKHGLKGICGSESPITLTPGPPTWAKRPDRKRAATKPKKTKAKATPKRRRPKS